MAGRVRVYIACSLDGYIAGVDDDLTWLDPPEGQPDPTDHTEGGIDFDTFIADVGCLLMGRRTHDVVAGFGVDWPYGELPVLVPTHRPLEPAHPTVRAVRGPIEELVAEAVAAADGGDVYLDGGVLIRQALDAGLVDELIITLIPTALGAGIPLFAGIDQRHDFTLVQTATLAGRMAQLVLRPR